MASCAKCNHHTELSLPSTVPPSKSKPEIEINRGVEIVINDRRIVINHRRWKCNYLLPSIRTIKVTVFKPTSEFSTRSQRLVRFSIPISLFSLSISLYIGIWMVSRSLNCFGLPKQLIVKFVHYCRWIIGL